MKDVYSITEVSNTLGVTRETLRRWGNSGKIVPARHPINNYRVYRSIDLLQFEKIGFMFKDSAQEEYEELYATTCSIIRRSEQTKKSRSEYFDSERG